MEKSRTSRHWFPWKPDTESGETEEDCEDPERLVLFDDISSCVIPVVDEKEQFRLIYCFIHFLGVPLQAVGCNTDVINKYCCHIDDGTFLKASSDIILNCTALAVEDKQKLVFIENVVKYALPKLQSKYQTILLCIFLEFKTKFIHNLAICGKKEKKAAWKDLKKYAKSLLKEEQNRNNLLLWEAYAKIELQSGNIEEAYRILDTALLMFGSTSLKSTDKDILRSACKLFRTISEMLIEEMVKLKGEETRVQESKVVYILSCLATADTYKPGLEATPALTLKARKDFQQNLDEYMDKYPVLDDQIEFKYKQDTLIHWTVCFAYFQYLTVGIKASEIVYQNVFDKLEDTDSNVVLEILTECKIKLLQLHVNRSLSPLCTLRIPLQQSLEKYPNNHTLLHAFVELENRSNIAGRLRRYFQRATRDGNSAVPWIYAIYAELERMKKLKDFTTENVTLSSEGTGNYR